MVIIRGRSKIEFYYVPEEELLCPKLSFTLSQTVEGVTECRVPHEKEAVQIFIM